MEEIWIVVETMLQIMQIVFSSKISEQDVTKLEFLIPMYLNKIMNLFETHLIPKNHFLLHYPRVIRNMGSPISMWMMRYESKHKVLTTFAKNSNNKVNICKTLAERHQESASHPDNIYRDDIIESKPMKLEQLNKYNDFILNSSLSTNTSEILPLKFLFSNGHVYRKGLMIMTNDSFEEILIVLCVSNE